MTYQLDPELQDLSLMRGGHLRKLSLRWASFMMRNTYRCLDHVDGIRYEKVKVGSFYIYVIIPDDGKENVFNAIIDYHGGAFAYRGWDNHFYCDCEYAKRTHSVVFYVDYRLSYQKTYQVSLFDSLQAYHWVMEQKERYSLDLNHLFLKGDSAGCYLALQVMEYIHRQNLPKVTGLLLLYPAVDPSQRCQSIKEYTDSPVWDSNSNREMWELYLKGHQEESFLDKELSYLDSVYVELCEFDCLHDEGMELFKKIKDNGNIVLNDTKGTCHGYDIHLEKMIVQNSIKQRCDFILNCLRFK